MKKNTGIRIGFYAEHTVRKNAIMLFFLLLGIVRCMGQAEILNTLKSNFEQYNNQFLQEKIFMHTDKSFYVAGEILWFKLYEVEGSLHKPIDLSKIAYVELINSDQKPVLQAKVALDKGNGNGSLFLPLSLNSGVYKMRAYSNWMKNFSADYFFEKTFTIINPLKKLEPVAPLITGYDIHFFPEGGNLVNGLQGKVAFRVTDQTGKGIDCKGSVVDQDNNTVASFESLKFGIGSFLFTPESSKRYKAVITMGSNNAVIAELPAIYEHGYTLQVEETGNNSQVKITIKANSNTADPYVYLFAHTRQVVKAAEVLLLNNGSSSFVISKDKLGDGISHFTLFNSAKQPLCERLYFKRPASPLVIDSKTEQEEYASRKKVYLDIFAHDENGQPEKATMSMSVFLADSLQSAGEEDISSYLWLSSDLKGNIESPGYYFKNTDAVANQAVDNLMLTHGWRRFKWEDILANKPQSFEFAPEYEGHLITGKITDKRSGLPVEKVSTLLSVPGEHYQLGGAISDQKGKVLFDIKNFYSTPEIIMAAGTPKDSLYRIDITNPFSEKFSSTGFPAFDFPESLQHQLISHNIYTQVQNTYLNDSLQQFKAPGSLHDTTAFYGQPDKKYFLDDYTRFVTMEEVVREYVQGLLLKKRQGKFHIEMMNDPWHVFFDQDPLALLDGVPVFDLNKIFDFDPLKIKKIEVVNREYFLGPLIADGVISFTTYKGDLGGFQLDPNAVILEYAGLQLQREFYAPLYDNAAQVASRMPDFRNVLYWAPDIKTGQTGKKQLSFFTSDQKGKYIVCIQGLTANGKSGSTVMSFEVKK